MLQKLLGTKVGMTQIFDQERNVIPVTVVNIADWYITQIKFQDKDGYSSLQIGMLRKRYTDQTFDLNFLQKKKKHFLHVREIQCQTSHDSDEYVLGQKLTLKDTDFVEGMKVDVSGVSKGLGFQGVMKRHGFKGGPASHGSKSHRAPGSSAGQRTQGEVQKGKKMPGHTGFVKVTVRGLKIVKIDGETGSVFIKGAIPGRKNTLLAIRTQG
ncbi:50S ribosomal protein L3 [Candidatus Dependentiae bacterium]|nr:MAG: 50S ribosomal protein L3 [Candidatus Dependentiae bacterium]